MTRIAAALCAILALAALTGCESMKQSWDSTWTSSKGYYSEYINPDPEIDLEQLGYTSTEEKLAKLFTPVDKPVADLAVYLNRVDTFPGEKWVANLQQRFPWINGLVIATLDGTMVAKMPEETMKPRNLQPILDHGDALRDRRLRSFTDQTPLGPEMYLGTALFKGNDLVGVIVVHFDPRSVVDFCPAPQELMVLTTDFVIWNGGDSALAEALLARPWNEMLAEQASGRVDENGTEYAWLTRYVGDKQLVYLTEAAVPREDEDDSFLWFF
ncbi:hypothetical protein [Desulfovibrio ferrophilus]|uniref:Lipoprotein n=1 Tax=Desulfovibrio ferrophilus TaxID=241368 RepID=A0A2Z6AX58_9BACT|nr:hypothetical protein [Desulfovibrio ferrophilus]BBD07800.1 uncharacterized protein DFE_1074 [Desulfovibrio ferrophilus]